MMEWHKTYPDSRTHQPEKRMKLKHERTDSGLIWLTEGHTPSGLAFTAELTEDPNGDGDYWMGAYANEHGELSLGDEFPSRGAAIKAMTHAHKHLQHQWPANHQEKS